MIVLINVKISPFRLNHYGRPNLKNTDRVDIFKYMISSYSSFQSLTSKYLIYVELEKGWEHRKDEIEEFIFKELPPEKVELHWYRHSTVEHWKNLYTEKLENLEDNILWFAGNDDHIFMDYDLKCLYYGLLGLERASNPYSAMFYSHWFETIKVAAKMGAKLDKSGHFVSFPWAIHDSIRVMRKELWKHYWFDHDFSHADGSLWRVDSIKDWTNDDIMCNIQIPTRELCRHFDGYSHVSHSLFNYGPPLEIPEGFFENNIKIKYGYDRCNDYRYTNINPLNPHLKPANPITGTDYKITINKLPMFWKNKISEIIEHPEVDETLYDEKYEEYILDSTKLNFGAYCMNFSNEIEDKYSWFKGNRYE
jgi:hypothetical protein